MLNKKYGNTNKKSESSGSKEGAFRRKTSNSKTGSDSLQGELFYAVLQSLRDVSILGVKLEKLFKKSKNPMLGRQLIDEIPQFVANDRFEERGEISK